MEMRGSEGRTLAGTRPEATPKPNTEERSDAPHDCLSAVPQHQYDLFVMRRSLAGTAQLPAVPALTPMPQNHRHGLRTVHDASQLIATLDDAWTLLGQAPERQMMLLRPAHPSPEDLDCLRAWIQECVASVHQARGLEALAAHSDEKVHVEEVAARIAGVVDAFHIYASMLERFRQGEEPGLLLQSRPLAAVADDQRVLLSCRAAVRNSLQQLFDTL